MVVPWTTLALVVLARPGRGRGAAALAAGRPGLGPPSLKVPEAGGT